jgi:hypothetical protein
MLLPCANAPASKLLNEACSVESSDGARRGAGVTVVGVKRSKSLNVGCGGCLADAGGGSHVCCCEAVVDGVRVFAGAVSIRRCARESASGDSEKVVNWIGRVVMVGDGDLRRGRHFVCLCVLVVFVNVLVDEGERRSGEEWQPGSF